MYVQVNIGRQAGSAPLSYGLWQNFQSDVCEAIIELAQDLGADEFNGYDLFNRIEAHRGVGQYDGYTEEGMHLSLFLDRSNLAKRESDEIAKAWTDFKRHIRRIGHAYKQDAIAIIARSQLVKVTDDYVIGEED